MNKIYVVVSHPIQYNSPFFDALYSDPALELSVIYLSSFGLNDSFDKGFSTKIRFDVPLVDNHNYEILRNLVPPKIQKGILRFVNPKLWIKIINEDATFIFYGWNNISSLIGILICQAKHRRFYLRSDGNLLRGKSHRNRRQIFLHSLRVLILNRFLVKATGALYIGKQNKLYYEKIGFHSSNLHFVPFAIDSQRFSSSFDAELYSNFSNSHRFKNMKLPICIYVGKLILIKDVDLLLQTAVEFRDKCNFLVVGSGPEGDNLKKKYESYENIHFEGFVNQMLLPTLYKLCSFVCLPSRQESWGLTINESISCGLIPIVSDSVGCFPDLVATTSGLVFKTGDSLDLFEKITRALELQTDNETKKRIREISEKYSINNAVQLLKIALDFR